ncbi:bacteriocin-like protein [Chryseobacterium sp. MIQD13]|uniref:bacteriocin-like protein n=1 Tax=Chryseobacterium sp. MIQD13 TaxID=3422310 RepID=UPI003D283B8A
MKNLKKLSKRDLKTIIGGGAPSCPTGYKPCVAGEDDNGGIIWTCIWSSLPCNP